jgi:hypothetical protein
MAANTLRLNTAHFELESRKLGKRNGACDLPCASHPLFCVLAFIFGENRNAMVNRGFANLRFTPLSSHEFAKSVPRMNPVLKHGALEPVHQNGWGF